jgi:hypothetical protein
MKLLESDMQNRETQSDGYIFNNNKMTLLNKIKITKTIRSI